MRYVRKRRNYRRKGTKKNTKRSGVSSSVKKYVKKAISSNIENKHYVTFGNNVAITCAQGGATPPVALNLTPLLSQGTTQNTRIGNLIHLKSMILDLDINLREPTAISNLLKHPYFVRVMIFKFRYRNDGTFDSGSIFNGNAGGNLAFQGTINDMRLNINRDVFIPYYDRVLKLGVQQTGNAIVTTQMIDQYASYTHHLKINVGKWMPKKLKYDDTATLVTNTNLYCAFQVVSSDGSALGSILQGAEYHYALQGTFEDA